ncbi:hypothetical protein AYO39_00470 [Actinobacteria bacterium SCGC AG-212-D09]|nr:hypothetical protein AYO39_00470 [Actinobacteria bacterium SCGC AG-212-D09]
MASGFDGADLDAFERADAGLVVAHLSYRARVTRCARPSLSALVREYGSFGDGPGRIARWTDRRIAYAAGHGTLPDRTDRFPRQVAHNAADSYLTIAQLAFRGGLSSNAPSLGFIEQRYGSFLSHGPEFMIRWTDQRLSEAAAGLKKRELARLGRGDHCFPTWGYLESTARRSAAATHGSPVDVAR